MRKTREPGGDVSAAPGSILIPVFKTVYRKHPYIALLLLGLVVLLPFRQQSAGVIAWAKQVYSSPIAKNARAEITAPWSGEKVPFTVRFEGTISDLPPDRDLFLSIKNSANQLFLFKAEVLLNRFNLTHHLGNKDQDVGQDFKVGMFIPDEGVTISEGLQPSLPPGQYVSKLLRYTRRANLPGEE